MQIPGDALRARMKEIGRLAAGGDGRVTRMRFASENFCETKRSLEKRVLRNSPIGHGRSSRFLLSSGSEWVTRLGYEATCGVLLSLHA